MELPAIASTSAATAAAAATIPATASPSSCPFYLGARLVDIQRTSAHLCSIQCGDGFLSVFGISHLHKSESPRPARLAIGHNADPIDLSVGFEYLTQFLLGRIKVQVSHENVLQAIASQ